MTTPDPDSTILELTANIVSSHVSHNSVRTEDLPSLITSVYESLNSASSEAAAPKPAIPVVPVRQSVFDDHLVCLECGKSFRVMKRHLQTEHRLSESAYRERFALPHDYPLVAPEYAEVRSRLAKEIGLGTKRTHVRRLSGPRRTASH